MKNLNIIHILLFLICMLIYKCASAQNDYVITTKGDTVYGELKMLTLGPEKKVQVKNDKKKDYYSIFQTKEVNYNGEKYFPIKGPNGYVYMKLQKPGYLSVYAYQTDNKSMYDAIFLVKADGSSLDLPNLGFKKQMSNFLEDCPSISTRIDQGELNKKDMDLIVDEYNSCIETRTKRTEQSINQNIVKSQKISSWDALEEAIKAHPDFEGKPTALEMVDDIQRRISRSEKVPNFVVEGLKSTLASQADLKDDLNKALSEME